MTTGRLRVTSGIRLAQASHDHEELLIVRGMEIADQRRIEKADFDYAAECLRAYHPIAERRALSRER